MPEISQKIFRNWPLLLVLVLLGGILGYLLHTHILQEKDSGLYSAGVTSGDLAYHMSLVSSFRERGVIPTIYDNPIYAGKKLSYPFIPDLLSALLMKAGLSMRLALILPVFFAAMIFIILSYFLVIKITASRLAGALMPILLFFNGSFYSVLYLLRDLSSDGLSSGFLNLHRDYSSLKAVGIVFSNILINFILPQRSFVFGLVLGVAALWFFWSYWSGQKKRDLLSAGIFISFLPWVHAHSFVALNLAACFLFITELFSSPNRRTDIIGGWSLYLVPILVLGLPQWMVINPSDRGEFLRFTSGWMNEDRNILIFWLQNLPQLAIIALAVYFSPARLRNFWLAFTGILVIANIIIFQPHDWDNMKLMIWWYLVSMVLVAGFIARLLSKNKKVYFCMALVAMVFVGAFSVYGEMTISTHIFSKEDVVLADFIRASTQNDALFLTSDRWNNPVAALSGRQIYLGYGGWLWTHGIDVSERLAEVRLMYGGSEDLLGAKKIDYVLIESGKTDSFNPNIAHFLSNHSLIYDQNGFLLFKVSR